MIFPPEGEKHNRCLGAVHVVIPEQYISTYIAAFSARLNASYGVERPFRHDFYYRDNEGNFIGDKNLPDETLMYALLKREAMPPHLRKALDIAVDLANDTRQFSGESDKQSPAMTDIVDSPQQTQMKRSEVKKKENREELHSKKMTAVQFAIENPNIRIDIIEQQYKLKKKALSRPPYREIIRNGRQLTRSQSARNIASEGEKHEFYKHKKLGDDMLRKKKR
jgi:hypothetical protein